RERLRGQLILALYRSGRQADALAEYQNARRTLVDELGLEPGGELQALERAILTHDAALDPPSQAVVDLEARPRLLSRRALITAIPGVIAVSTGLAFALRGGGRGPRLLAPNSVGFIDAKSGRVTRDYVVGQEPSSLIVAFDNVWVATYRDRIVTRFDRLSGHRTTISVQGRPTGLVADRDKVFVWTIERQLIPIDPQRSNLPEDPLRLGEGVKRALAPFPDVTSVPPREGGRIASGGDFLWVAVPAAETVLRVNPSEPERTTVISSDDGVRPAIASSND